MPYRLVTVSDGSTAEGPVIYQAEQSLLQDAVQPVTLAQLQDANDAQVEQLTLEFLMPGGDSRSCNMDNHTVSAPKQ